MDDKIREDHLYWVFQVCKLLNYLEDSGEINNQPGWATFFKDNPEVVYALIHKVRFAKAWEALKKTEYFYADYEALRARVATLLKTDLEHDHDPDFVYMIQRHIKSIQKAYLVFVVNIIIP